MEFPEYLDTRELATLCNDAVDVVDNPDDYNADELAGAYQTLSAMADAQRSLNLYGFQDVEDGGNLADNWRHVEDEIHCTLIREDGIGDYWEEKVVEFGYMTQTAVDLMNYAIDWDKFARGQENVTIVFPDLDSTYGRKVTYYIF